MPNWCENQMTFRGTEQLLKILHEAVQSNQLFQTVLPIPLALRITCEQSPPDPRAETNREQLGYRTWYDFAGANWGTKWEMDSTSVSLFAKDPSSDQWTLIVRGLTAWGPPLGIYSSLAQLGCSVAATYWEPGMDFAGVWCDHGARQYNNISQQGEEFWDSTDGDWLDTVHYIRDHLEDN
jgi:hypothetical protein